MKKITILLFALIAGAFAMSAQPQKGPMRSSIYTSLPSGFVQAGESSIYYSIAQRQSAGPGNEYGISILGEINGQYYSSTYGGGFSDNPGAGFIPAFQVNGNTAHYMSSAGTTTYNGVSFTPKVEGQGEVAAKITFTLVNTNNSTVTVNVGAWADVYIGTNDYAPISRLNDDNGETYALDLKESMDENSPLLCVLFGEGVTGVSPIDDFWFGYYRNNYDPDEIVGDYDNQIPGFLGLYEVDDPDWMSEEGGYDSGMGFCWKNRTIGPGETLELSFLISVGNIPFDDPIPDDPDEPGQDVFTYQVEAENIAEWNDLTVDHPAHIWGEYEHPYGQEGFIEYMVDGDRGEWTRIETPLVSGESYDLPFVMQFNPDITDIHTLKLRFTDGLGNYSELNGLAWEDVRSISIEGIEDRVYNGEPQIFEVVIGGVITETIGADGAYTNPGNYSYAIYGKYDMNTIGVNEVPFIVDRGQPDITVIVPDDCVYDGEPHAATVELVQGDGAMTVTYVNTATNETSTEAPVLPGTYTVVVTVAETDHYYGLEETVGTFTIDKAQSVVDVVIPGNVEHDGQAHGATVTLLVGDTEPVVTYYLVGENEVLEPIVGLPIEEGVYVVVVTVPESQLYYGTEGTYGPYQIYIPTAINELNMDTEANGAWYTIQGVRVSAPTAPGVYIHNGKKYIVK